ncbi:hypothetical protein HMPREF3226_00847 [Prevotella corporis]|uniref:Uncharacterized protein n=1 Tax=Prevotella corporis TaxID=28128 RepID=A0A133QF69_9BACT|nr:hypothetical protein HMPREF3226_00847 [Prevotella corporis]
MKTQSLIAFNGWTAEKKTKTELSFHGMSVAKAQWTWHKKWPIRYILTS